MQIFLKNYEVELYVNSKLLKNIVMSKLKQISPTT